MTSSDRLRAILRRETGMARKGPRALFLLHGALKGVLVAPRQLHHLGNLGFGNLEGKNAYDRKPLVVDGQHDIDRVLM